MNFNFDTASLTPVEAQATILFLSRLFPPAVIPAAPEPAQATQVAAVPQEAAGPVLVPSTAPAPSLSPEPETEPTTRRRRTKAEMAADAALQQAGHLPPTTTAEPAAQPVNGALKTVSADELRALLNAFIQKHSMEEAIGKLKAFGCNRVSEALALDPAKLNELAGQLNG